MPLLALLIVALLTIEWVWAKCIAWRELTNPMSTVLEPIRASKKSWQCRRQLQRRLTGIRRAMRSAFVLGRFGLDRGGGGRIGGVKFASGPLAAAGIVVAARTLGVWHRRGGRRGVAMVARADGFEIG